MFFITGAIEVAKPLVDDHIQNEVLPNYCLGMTLTSSDPFLDAIRAIALGTPVAMLKDVRVWPEPCDTSKPLIKLLDQTALPVAPDTSGNDVAPETKAPSVTVPTKKPQAPNLPREVGVSMTDACHLFYASSDRSRPDRYASMQDPNSWYCVDAAGKNLGGVDLARYCGGDDGSWSGALPGSRPVNVDGTAFGWRCRR